MQENEFEKRMQQQMEEFKLRPSDAVWQKVEEELKKKKKRRIVFFLFLLAGLSLLSYTGYFLFNYSKPGIADKTFTSQTNTNTVENNTTDLAVDSSTTSNENESIKQDQLIIKPNPIENSSVAEELKSEKAPALAKERRPDEKQVMLHVSPSDKIVHDPVIKRSNAVREKAAPRKKITDKKQGQRGNEPAEIVIDRKAVDTKNDVTINVERTNEDIVNAQPDPLLDKIEIKDELAIDSVRKDSALAKLDEKQTEQGLAKTTKKSNAGIRWAFDFGIGLSGMRDNAFLFSNGQKSMMDQVYNSPGNSGNFYTPPVSPSSTKAGPAFKLGIVAQKQIAKRSSVSAGLQYAYFNTRMKVGSYRDTSVVLSNSVSQSLRLNAVYRGVHQKDYTNHYHFIQLPIQYHLQLNKGKKLPIFWNVGASAGYLISSNALVYDTAAGGIYYRDAAIFNKWQFNLNTGFSFLFGKPQKLQWSIGPDISLGMKKLVKDAYNQRQYLLYGGLSGRIIFSRKK